MIKLNSIIDHNFTINNDFVVKIENDLISDTSCVRKNDKWRTKYGSFNFKSNLNFEIGEILIIYPKKKFIERFFRPSANSNTILLTENCDQKCLMCSQPPKNKDYLNFDMYEKACDLVPKETVIGISGGEPTLFKRDLFLMLRKILEKRPDINFHILSNGQHFEKSDISDLIAINSNILWGIPIYSSSEVIHDFIVGKKNAFSVLNDNLELLRSSGSRLEIRTVVMKNNINDLENIAINIYKNHNWLEVWAIMQLEKYGFAKINWENIFFDTSQSFEAIQKALIATKLYDINTKLYNFPYCTVPEFFKEMTVKSISDWKQKFIDECTGCNKKNNCCGFFEWYDGSYKNIRALN